MPAKEEGMHAAIFLFCSLNHICFLSLLSAYAPAGRRGPSMVATETASLPLPHPQEYVKCLEDRVQLLEQQNLTLIQEIKKLKGLQGGQPPPHMQGAPPGSMMQITDASGAPRPSPQF